MVKYIITLNAEEREMLQNMIRSGTERARKLTRARILLKADEGWKDKDVCLEGLEAGLNRRRPRREYSRSSTANRRPA